MAIIKNIIGLTTEACQFAGREQYCPNNEAADAAGKQETQTIAAAGSISENLTLDEVLFDPVAGGRNVLHVRVKNNTDKTQVLGLHVQTRSYVIFSEGIGWGTCHSYEIGPKESRLCRFVYKIPKDVDDKSYVRLRFSNPVSADSYSSSTYSLERKIFGNELKRRPPDERPFKMVDQQLAEIIIDRFWRIQDSLREKDYERAWEAFTSDFQAADFAGGFHSFKMRMDREWNSWGWERDQFLGLEPREVQSKGDLLLLQASFCEATWTIGFAKDGIEWKLDSVEGFEDRAFAWPNWQERLLPNLQKRLTPHFEIYYAENTLAAKDIDAISSGRENAYEEICEIIGVDPGEHIRLVFFENPDTKLAETGHQGAGWATGTTIVEIYNELVKLDPYHEATHILARKLGHPPAIFTEGLATYMSERLGASALRNLGGGQSSLYDRCRELKAEGQWIPLEELLTYTDIGPDWSRPPIAYPEAAAFVKFLIEIYGKCKFLKAYKELQGSSDDIIRKQNVEKLEGIYGKSLTGLQEEWFKAIGIFAA